MRQNSEECLVVCLSSFYNFKYCRSGTKKGFDDPPQNEGPPESPLWLMHLIKCYQMLVPLSNTLIYLPTIHAQSEGFFLRFFPGRICLTVMACDAGVHLHDDHVLTSPSSRTKFHVRQNHSDCTQCEHVALSGKGARGNI